MKAAVYWNLRKDCFSVQSRERENYGRVVRHADSIILKDVIPTVRETGRLRVLEEGRKNVHAFLVGEVVDEIDGDVGRFDYITYNPYRMSAFQTEDGREVVYSPWVHCVATQGRPSLMSYGTITDFDVDSLQYEGLPQ